LFAALSLSACTGDPDFTRPDEVDVGDVDSPRVPDPPDLRFQWVGAFPTYHENLQTNVVTTPSAGGTTRTVTGAYTWSPLQLGSEESWEMVSFTPTSAIAQMVSVAQAGLLADVETDLAALLESHGVVTSLDYGFRTYALTMTTPVSGNPVYNEQAVETDRASFEAWAAMVGTHGYVVTALSGDGTTIHALAFAPVGEARTFETQVVDATAATLVARASDLAAGGYTITAFGHDGNTTRILVGTRPTGVTTPRAIASGGEPSAMLAEGYAVVAWDWDVVSDSGLVILER
jgi:hypothetical protein